VEEHRLRALAALGPVGGARCVDAIPRLTELALERDGPGRGVRRARRRVRHRGSLCHPERSEGSASPRPYPLGLLTRLEGVVTYKVRSRAGNDCTRPVPADIFPAVAAQPWGR